MTVAIPIWQDRVSPVFDAASRLLVVRRGRGRKVDRQELALDSVAPDALIQTVMDLGIDVLLCAAISYPLRLALERRGVRVEGNLCGEVEPILRAFHAGTWRKFRMPGCHAQGTASTLVARSRPPRMAQFGRVRS